MSTKMTEGRARSAWWLGAGGVVVAVTFAPLPAWGQQLYVTGPLAGAPAVRKEYSYATSDSSRSSKRDSRIVMPTGHLEVAGEMAFLMSKTSPYTQRLALTDMALFRLSLRRSFADWLELLGGVDVLPKQPTSTHASLFQGVHLGAQAEYAPGLGAALGVGVGPLLGADGVFYRAGPGLSYKPKVSEYLRFVLGVGNAWTILDYRGKSSSSFWLGEIVSHAETQIGDDNASMWVGMDYAVPFASRPRASAPDLEHGYLNPQVRLNLEVGGTLSLRADGWDVYASYTIVDRGELNRPETTLPILDGGFDQQQIAIGVEYRFEPKRRHDQPAW